MQTLEYYYRKDEHKDCIVETYVEVNEPHCITTVCLQYDKEGGMVAQFADQSFTGPALSELRLKCKPSNFNIYKDGRQLAWNHYTQLLNRNDHGSRFEIRKHQYAQRQGK